MGSWRNSIAPLTNVGEVIVISILAISVSAPREVVAELYPHKI